MILPGDRFTNHERLFGEWTRAGFRVIGFDLPNHGGTVDKAFGTIDSDGDGFITRKDLEIILTEAVWF